MQRRQSLIILILVSLLLGACGSGNDEQVNLEEVLSVQLPAAAENIQIHEVSGPGENTTTWWVRFDVSPNVAEVFLQDIAVEITDTGPGDVYDPTLTYPVTPPDWWFEGFDATVTYATGTGSPGGGTHIFVYVDQSAEQRWIVSLEVNDR